MTDITTKKMHCFEILDYLKLLLKVYLTMWFFAFFLSFYNISYAYGTIIIEKLNTKISLSDTK